ncbi:MAG: hypothetical protein U0575_03300 [Phycisphaerales bacterium]
MNDISAGSSRRAHAAGAGDAEAGDAGREATTRRPRSRWRTALAALLAATTLGVAAAGAGNGTGTKPSTSGNHSTAAHGRSNGGTGLGGNGTGNGATGGNDSRTGSGAGSGYESLSGNSTSNHAPTRGTSGEGHGDRGYRAGHAGRGAPNEPPPSWASGFPTCPPPVASPAMWHRFFVLYDDYNQTLTAHGLPFPLWLTKKGITERNSAALLVEMYVWYVQYGEERHW